MLKFLLAKCIRMLTILLAVLLVTFLLMHAIPGNPWSNFSSSERYNLGLSLDQSSQNQLARHFGLDLPLWRQFTRDLIGYRADNGDFNCGLVCGNLGPSSAQRGRTVQDILFAAPEGKTSWESRFGYSIRLVLFGAVIAVGLGIPLGTFSAGKPNSPASRFISVILAAMISVPNFILGLLAVIILASWLKVINVLPDWTQFSSWIVPASVLAVMPMASIARVTNAAILNTLNEDYVRTAHAKGLSKSRVMLIHVMRNAMVPIITFIGPSLIEMFTGLLVIENLYAFPGFGREYWSAVLKLDYPLILGLTLIYAAGFLLVNLIVEVVSERLDPRISIIAQPGAQ